jgi:NADH-quinone oxidoreductase subunit L
MGTIAAVLGISVSWAMYAGSRTMPARLAKVSGPLYGFSQNRFYVDELFSWLIVRPLKALGRLGLMFDRYVIDALLDLIAAVPRSIGFVLRPAQNGRVPSYAILMLTGLMACLVVLILLDSL